MSACQPQTLSFVTLVTLAEPVPGDVLAGTEISEVVVVVLVLVLVVVVV